MGVYASTTPSGSSNGTNYVLQGQGDGTKFYKETASSGDITVLEEHRSGRCVSINPPRCPLFPLGQATKTRVVRNKQAASR